MPHGHGLAAVPMPALMAVARAARGTPGVPKHSRKGARVSSHAQWRTGIGFYPCHAHSRATHTHLPSVARAAEAMAEKYSSEMLAVDNAESGALLEELMEVREPPAETPQGRAAGPRSQGAAGLAAPLRPGLAVRPGRGLQTPFPTLHPCPWSPLPCSIRRGLRSWQLFSESRPKSVRYAGWEGENGEQRTDRGKPPACRHGTGS